jgi:hypothetical protein
MIDPDCKVCLGIGWVRENHPSVRGQTMWVKVKAPITKAVPSNIQRSFIFRRITRLLDWQVGMGE